jgi:DegV family protein with EDD domain
VSISNAEVIAKLKKRDVQTKPFYPAECADFYEEMLKKYDHIFSFHLSQHISGNYKSAVSALGFLTDESAERITVLDMGCVSCSLGLVVKKGVELIREDPDPATIAQRLEPYIENTYMGFTVENLTWLRKGGRVGRFAAAMGGMLNVKPIIQLQEGKLVATEKQRGKKAALKRLVELTSEHCRALGGESDIWVAYADNLEEAVIVRESLAAAVDSSSDAIKMVEVGATIAVHTGPGSLLIAVSPKLA